MTRRITAKVDTYQKDGETKGRYIDVGVILSGEHGEYILLNPNVDLAGVLIQQRILNPQKASKAVLCNIFDNDRQQSSGSSAPASGDMDDDIPF